MCLPVRGEGGGGRGGRENAFMNIRHNLKNELRNLHKQRNKQIKRFIIHVHLKVLSISAWDYYTNSLTEPIKSSPS